MLVIASDKAKGGKMRNVLHEKELHRTKAIGKVRNVLWEEEKEKTITQVLTSTFLINKLNY